MQRRDAGVSDVIGTVMLVAVTLSLVVVATVSFQNAAQDEELEAASVPPALRVTALPESGDRILLTHSGGESYRLSDLRLFLESQTQSLVAGAPLHEVAGAGADDAFAIGREVRIDLGSCALEARPSWCAKQIVSLEAEADGRPLSLTLRSASHRLGIVSETALHPRTASGVAAAAELPTLVPLDPPAGETPVERKVGQTLHLAARVQLPTTLGRASLYGVSASLTEIGGPDAWPLFDDGTHGDSAPGDLTYEGYFFVPNDATLADGTTRTVRFTVLSSEGADQATAQVELVPSATVTTTLPVVIDQARSPSPKTVAPLQPVFIHGTGFSFVNAVTLRNTGDGSVVPAVWALMPTSPPGTAVQLLAPTNPSPSDQSYLVTLSSPFSTDTTTVPLVIVGQESTSVPESTPPPPTTSASGSGDAGGATGSSTCGSGLATPSVLALDVPDGYPYTQVVVTGNSFACLQSVVLKSTAGSFAMAWAPIDATHVSFVTHAGIPPGEYRVVVTNVEGSSSTQLVTFTVLAPPSPSSLAAEPMAARGGDEVVVTGANLGTVTRVHLTAEASRQDAAWWISGTKLHFVVPTSMSPGEYAVAFTSASGLVTLPGFTVQPLPDPAFDATAPLTPSSAAANTQVTIKGSHLQQLTYVKLANAAGESFPVAWVPTSDTQLVFLVPAGVPPGPYSVVLARGPVQVSQGGFTVTPPPSVSNLVLASPTSLAVDQVGTVTGQNLAFATSVTLFTCVPTSGDVVAPSSGTTCVAPSTPRTLPVTWWLDPGSVRFVVPASATPGTYLVGLTSQGASAVVQASPALTVTFSGPPSITQISPLNGLVNTQVNVFGTNFVNVQAVAFTSSQKGLPASTLAFYQVLSTTQIVVTVPNVPPGGYAISVTTITSTGAQTVSSPAFTVNVPPPAPVYPPGTFTYFGSTVQSSCPSNCNGKDPQSELAGTVKLQLADATSTAASARIHWGTMLNKKSTSGSAALSMDKSSTCASTDDGVFRFTVPSGTKASYKASTEKLYYHFTVVVQLQDGTTQTITINSNDQSTSGKFTLGPVGSSTNPNEVKDNGNPQNFSNCNP